MTTLRRFIKKITHPFLKKGLQFYYRKPRPYTYDDITVIVHPNVFPPHLTLSTKILLDFISEIDLEQKTFLELGCGSGIISLFASKKGATVTASDINTIALDYLKIASEKNKLKVQIVESNLFDAIPRITFDYIFVNPPYYPKKPTSIKQQAWFCGENFEYFIALFRRLPAYISAQNNTFMILSEDCDLEHIFALAHKNNLQMESVFEVKKTGELNYIFQIKEKI